MILMKAVEQWHKSTGIVIEPDAETKMISELDDAFSALGIAIR